MAFLIRNGSIRPAGWNDDPVTGMAIERAALVAALADVEPADQACRAALEEGATFELSNLTTSTAELVTIYDRRVRHLREKKSCQSAQIRLSPGCGPPHMPGSTLGACTPTPSTSSCSSTAVSLPSWRASVSRHRLRTKTLTEAR